MTKRSQQHDKGASDADEAPAASLALETTTYEALHQVARRAMRHERAGHTLQATALANEAYLALVKQRNISVGNRQQVIALGAQMMRRVLVDHARAKGRIKRGGEFAQVTLHDGAALSGGDAVDLIALDEAMAKLARVDERQCRVVELRFFGGLGNQEIADELKVSRRTVDGDWRIARAWLRRELSEVAG
jgi:RNA polymerase sigma-70 factor (ECF subfamily)